MISIVMIHHLFIQLYMLSTTSYTLKFMKPRSNIQVSFNCRLQNGCRQLIAQQKQQGRSGRVDCPPVRNVPPWTFCTSVQCPPRHSALGQTVPPRVKCRLPGYSTLGRNALPIRITKETVINWASNLDILG